MDSPQLNDSLTYIFQLYNSMKAMYRTETSSAHTTILLFTFSRKFNNFHEIFNALFNFAQL